MKFLNDPGLEDCMRITLGTVEQDASVMAAFHDIVGQGDAAGRAYVHAATGKR